MNTFAEKLTAWREREKLPQGKAAILLGITRSYLNQIENGNREAGPKIVNRLAEIMENAASFSVYNPREKLTAALAEHDLTPAALAKKIGYDAGVIANVVRGTGKASEKMIEAIIKELPELSKEDLMGGSDSPTVISSDDSNGLTYGSKPTVALPPGMKGRNVPLLSMAQAGGWDAGHSDEGWSGECAFALNVDDRRAFAIKVSGNSMEPEIREGDVVICSPAAELTQGCCAVVRTKSDAAFIKFWRKRGDSVTLESANSDYKPLHFPLAEIAGAWPVIQRIASGMIKKQL